MSPSNDRFRLVPTGSGNRSLTGEHDWFPPVPTAPLTGGRSGNQSLPRPTIGTRP
jgi:hypothetical protein